jgi:hypothetical protein
VHHLRFGQHLEQIFGGDERAAADAGVPNSTLLVFAAVMSSARLFTGLPGWTTIASGAEPTIAAGLMSSVA